MKQQRNKITYRISASIGKSIISLLEFFIRKSVKDEIYLPLTDFDWINSVESDFSKIKKEYTDFYLNNRKALDICKISEEQFNVVDENQWDFIPLYFYGTKIKSYSQFFPETIKSLEKIPELTTAFFSIIKPGTNIKEHRGAYKGYLRYQLGIQIPQPETQCGLKINNKTYHWKEGESVIFDDTFLHSAWNHSHESRTVLYVDFIRPMNRYLMYISRLLTRIINKSPFVQNGILNLNSALENNDNHKR